MRKAKYFQKSDERILGESEFVDRVLSAVLFFNFKIVRQILLLKRLDF